MKVIALHRLYQRTCKDCGYHWTVTRAQAQLMVQRPRIPRGAVRGTGGRGVGQSYIGDVIQAGEAAEQAQVELVEQFRQCAKCGADRFSQRPVTKRHPADPPEV